MRQMQQHCMGRGFTCRHYIYSRAFDMYAVRAIEVEREKAILMNVGAVTLIGWMDGWMDGWAGGWLRTLDDSMRHSDARTPRL